ncbi:MULTISPECIES: hypothetical protein [Sphaerospermopsis]|jgi:hypothetical protein|uniref:Addiction module component n=1 Tax=Sphaerospermopsis torques-reginae ITEP-024 TaxID=984208 RepID=A0ABX8WYB1_9CYAN|nr:MULTISPECIES: hypothetical protein [Sphaerospermopsis]MBE9057414.1 hypothetical protein [Sphaerospermopsis sp. LEGE 08334]QYX31442.1 hypothetical protein K2F26_21970 [Sphaerospermopsis torques-reginae ITEP-024]
MTTIKLQIPLESLIEAIASLSLAEKQKILQFLEEDLINDDEDNLIEENPQIMKEIAEARKAYQNGDYQTIQEYIKNHKRQIS